MRTLWTARTAAVLALACLPFLSIAAYAMRKPTKVVAHEPARHLVGTPSVTHDRAAHKAAPKAGVVAGSKAGTKAGMKAGSGAKVAVADRSVARPSAKSSHLPQVAAHAARGVPVRRAAHTVSVTTATAQDRVHAWIRTQPATAAVSAPKPVASRSRLHAAAVSSERLPATSPTQLPAGLPSKSTSTPTAGTDGSAQTVAPDRQSTGVSHPPEDDQTAPYQTSPTETPSDVPSNLIGLIREGGDRSRLPSIGEQASTPVYLASLYDKRGRLVMPAPLKGSRDILLHQNMVADRDGLKRIQDDDDLLEMRRTHTLVALPVSQAVRIDERLPLNRRFARPWAAEFLAGVGADHYARFHAPLQVNSAVRTAEFQLRLLRTNGNAAPADGETASPHLTGQAIDIAKRGMSLAEIAWMRAYLLPMVNAGKIDVEEEFQQACFHISVYRQFTPAVVPRVNLASAHHVSAGTLAAAIQ